MPLVPIKDSGSSFGSGVRSVVKIDEIHCIFPWIREFGA